MMRLGDTKTLGNGKAQRTPLSDWPLERILRLPHTAAIRAKLARLTVGSGGDGAGELAALVGAQEDAEERDLIAAERPDGCWCFGRGGLGERAVMVAGDDVPMVLSVYCRCPDGEARKAQDAEVRDQGKAYFEALQLRGAWDGARIPERFRGCTLDTFPISTPKTKAIVSMCREWLDGPDWAIVLTGDYGVGKTGLGIGIQALGAERRMVGLFVKAPDLLAKIRATYAKNADLSELEVLESLRTVPLLMLDDLGIGAEQLNDWASTMLFQVLDTRHDNGRKTIITSNLSLSELAVHLGERTMHRFEEGATFLQVEGPNLRKSERE